MAEPASAHLSRADRHPRPGRAVEPLLLAALLALAAWLRVPNLDAYTGSFDEGIRAQQLLLMAAGYRPFQDIFASQGPLLLDLLFPFYLAFGQTLAAARAGVVACSLVALVGAWWAARAVAGPLAGLAAAGVLAVSPTFLEGSRLALAEVPTIAPALLALASLLAYRRQPARRLLVTSAACAAFALLVKPMVLHVGVPIAVLLLLPDRATGMGTARWRRRLADTAIYGGVVATLCAVTIMLLGPAQVWDNLGAYRGGAGSAAGARALENLRLTANVMRQEQAGFFVLALAGAALGLWRRPIGTLALVSWAAAVLGLFTLYGDLADKHIVYLTPPLALLAGVGAGLGLTGIIGLARRWGAALTPQREEPLTPGDRGQPLSRVRERGAGGEGAPGDEGWRPYLAALIGLVGVAAYLWSLPAVSRADRYLLREAPRVAAERRGREVDREIAALIEAHTPPDGWVLADNPGAAFEARRTVIPYLVDTSGTRIDAGSLTSAVALEHVQRYRPSVIVTWPRRLGKLDDFTRRLPSLGYRLERSYELGWKVYVREQASSKQTSSKQTSSRTLL